MNLVPLPESHTDLLDSGACVALNRSDGHHFAT